MSYRKQPLDAGHNDTASRQPLPLDALLSRPQEWALFLDIDGTLLDLAETPDGILVPPALPFQLDAVFRKLGGAMALVTGRGLTYADHLFAPFQFPTAGLHGAERRDSEGQITRAEATPEFELLKAELAARAKGWDGVLIEDKGAAVAAHYRLAPERQVELEPLMVQFLKRAGPGWGLQRGKMVLEIRPASASKGMAVESFLAQTAFMGRKPIAIGDDVTDEAMFKAVNLMGGHSIRVGPPSAETAALGVMASAADVRDVVARIAA